MYTIDIMEFFRHLKEKIEQRLAEKEPLIQVVIGPRQVGKTTALKQALKGKGLYCSADFPTPMGSNFIEENWKLCVEKKDRILAIDEIQKIDNWSEVIKKLWDENPKKLKVVLTGSSALLMDKGLKETLAGRFELIRAEHWNFSEASKLFKVDVKKFVEFGCYPSSMQFLDSVERWGEYVRDSIVEPAIGRDLLQLRPVENPSLLRQVFGVAVANPAQILSLQKIQGQLQSRGAVQTVQNYLELLGQSFLVSGLQKYSASAFRAKQSSPKLIVHDNALVRAFERPISQKLESDRLGRYFENAVSARFIEAGWDTFYWNDRKLDVDLVVIGPNNEHWALEIKSTQTHKSELGGLKNFCALFPKFSPKLVSLVDQKIEGIESLNVVDVLSMSRK